MIFSHEDQSKKLEIMSTSRNSSAKSEVAGDWHKLTGEVEEVQNAVVTAHPCESVAAATLSVFSVRLGRRLWAFGAWSAAAAAVL